MRRHKRAVPQMQQRIARSPAGRKILERRELRVWLDVATQPRAIRAALWSDFSNSASLSTLEHSPTHILQVRQPLAIMSYADRRPQRRQDPHPRPLECELTQPSHTNNNDLPQISHVHKPTHDTAFVVHCALAIFLHPKYNVVAYNDTFRISEQANTMEI